MIAYFLQKIKLYLFEKRHQIHATVQHLVLKYVKKIVHVAPASDTPSPPCGPTWFFQEPPPPFAVHMVHGCPLGIYYLVTWTNWTFVIWLTLSQLICPRILWIPPV